MRNIVVFAVFLFCMISCLAPISGFAQQGESDVNDGSVIKGSLREILKSKNIIHQKPPEYSVKDIARLWQSVRKHLDKEEYEAAFKKINMIIQVKVQNGIRNLPNYSAAIAIESKKAIGKNNSEAALELAKLSRRMTPDYSFPHIVIAEAKREYLLKKKISETRKIDESSENTRAYLNQLF